MGTSVAIRYSLLSHANTKQIILFGTILKPIHTALQEQSLESNTGLTILLNALDGLKRALITDQSLKTTVHHHGVSFNKTLFEPSFLLLQKSCPTTITNDQEKLIEKILVQVDAICDELDTQTASNNEADLYCLALLWKQRMHDLVSLLSEDTTNNIGSLAQIWPTTQTTKRRTPGNNQPTKTQQQPAYNMPTTSTPQKQSHYTSPSHNNESAHQSHSYEPEEYYAPNRSHGHNQPCYDDTSGPINIPEETTPNLSTEQGTYTLNSSTENQTSSPLIIQPDNGDNTQKSDDTTPGIIINDSNTSPESVKDDKLSPDEQEQHHGLNDVIGSQATDRDIIALLNAETRKSMELSAHIMTQVGKDTKKMENLANEEAEKDHSADIAESL